MRNGMPGVSIERTDASGAGAIVLRTDITAFIGLAERGPLDTPVPVESWRQFQAHFGRLSGSAYLAYAVRGFFDNGGRRCWIVRIASRNFADDGAGGARPAELLLHDISGAPCWRCAATSPGSWGNELAVSWRRERPLTQRARRATAISASLASAAGFSAGELVSLSQSGRTVHRLLALVDAASDTLYWVHPDPAQRTAGQLAWSALDPAQTLSVERIAYTLNVSRRGGFVAQYRDLHPGPQHPRFIGAVLASPYLSGGNLVRSPPPLTDADLPQPPRLIQVEAIGSLPTAPPLPPLPLEVTPDQPLPLTLGADGLAGLSAGDFIGTPWTPQDSRDSDAARLRKGRGLQTLAAIEEISLVAIPDILIRPQPDPLYEDLLPPAPNPCVPCPRPAPPAQRHQPHAIMELPPVFSEADILRVQTALVGDCEARGDRFALLAPPFPRAIERQRGVRALIEWRRLLTENQPARAAALYAPWLAVAQADADVGPLPVAGSVANVRLIPPCGHVAGAIARTDLTLGVMHAPANIPVFAVADTRTAVSDAAHGELNDAGIDVLRAEFGRTPMLQGARTVSDDPDWRYVNTIRMVLALKRAFDVALRWAVFEPNDAPTRAAVAATLIAILTLFWERGAFAGATVEESFFVRCDDISTDSQARESGELIALVGIAPAAPAEFIVLRVGRQDNLPVISLAQEGAFA